MLLLLLLGCPPSTPDTGDTAETGDTGDTAETGDTGDTAETGDTGDTAGTCGAGGAFAVTVTDVGYTLDSISSTDPHALFVTVVDDDARVLDDNFAVGCCPTLSVTAAADPATCDIVATVTVLGDDCDCVGYVDVTYTLAGLPGGEWTLASTDATTTFTVP